MASDNLIITKEKSYGSEVRLMAKGRITSTTASVLQNHLESALNNRFSRIVLNMKKVEFLSSGGIRVILAFYKKVTAQGGNFHIEAPSENVRNVLGMVALDKMLLK